jgi:hypothetical protein
MIVAHVMGIPVEESVLQLAPAGAAMLTAVAVAGRASLGRLRRRLRHRSPGDGKEGVDGSSPSEGFAV